MMGFSEIIGHQKPLETLRAALTNRRLHHAYLMLGPEGVGKRTIALSLAKALHCSERENDFCGSCSNCSRIETANHPDVRTIEPGAGKKEIGIQQIREIEKELNFRAFSGKKIVIIDPAPLMNAAAQNALLKTLEEPPRDSLLILIAANTGGLLSTLRSRCLRLSFAPLPRDLIADFLLAKGTLTRDDAQVVAAMSMGSLRTALELDKEEVAAQRRLWIDIMSSLTRGNYRAALDAAEALSGGREESLQFLAWVETWYRDLLVHALTHETRELINGDMLPHIQQQSGTARLDSLLLSLSQVAGATARIQRNLNRRMVLEALFIGSVEAR